PAAPDPAARPLYPARSAAPRGPGGRGRFQRLGLQVAHADERVRAEGFHRRTADDVSGPAAAHPARLRVCAWSQAGGRGSSPGPHLVAHVRPPAADRGIQDIGGWKLCPTLPPFPAAAIAFNCCKAAANCFPRWWKRSTTPSTKCGWKPISSISPGRAWTLPTR